MEAVENQTNTDVFDWFIDFATNASTIWSFLGILLLIILSVVFLARLNSNLNKDSIKQIAIFERERKYIKELYIELNETPEMLRYFAFSTKWKSRIVKIFNSLFNDTDGKKLKKKITTKSFRLSKYISKRNLSVKLEEYKMFFNDLRAQQNDLRAEFGDYYFALQHSAFTYGRKIEKLEFLNQISNSKEVLLIGNAGNGKTNTLCGFANLLINNNYPCMFINSKTIKNNNCFDYFVKKLNIPTLIGSYSEIYLFITNLLLLLRRKHLIVIVDAINENDHIDFVESLGEFVNKLQKYKRIKILMSCRNEYFEARYKHYFESCCAPPLVINTRDFKYSERAKEQILSAYSEHFHFNGRISSNAKRTLFRSLILMRIFFEVYESKNDVIVDLNNYEIYKKYINKLISENDKIDFENILNNMVLNMITNSEYSWVETNELNIDRESFAELQKVLDNNFLISKTYVENEGLITESKKECLYFVFDELRDFCISRYLLKAGEGTEYKELFSLCTDLYDKRKAPLEGILKYSYMHFKSTAQFEFCTRILFSYCNEKVHHWKYDDRSRWHERRTELFHNFGITIIFSDIENILDFERDYIFAACKNDNHDFCQILFYLLVNEFERLIPDSGLLIELVYLLDSVTDFESLFYPFVSDRYERHYNERLIHRLYTFLERIKEKNSSFSIGTKQFILLICVADPTEYLLENFLEEIVAEGAALNLLLNNLQLDELRDELLVIKERYTHNDESKGNILEYLRQILEMGDELNVEN